MAQDLTTIETKAVAAARTRARVATLYASIGRDERSRSDTLPKPLDPATRKELEAYRRELHVRLRPISEATAEHSRAGVAIAAFLQGYINARSPDPTGTVKAYVAQVSDQPLFAILEALDDFRNGRVFDINSEGQRIPFTLDHAPSAPRLLAQVKKRASDVQEERHKCVRLLGITKIAEPDVSEEERNRVAAHMRSLADSLIIGRNRDESETRQKIRAEAAEARARTQRILQDAAERRRETAQAG